MNLLESWVKRNIKDQRQNLVEISKKELFILDGIIEQIELLKKICSNKLLETPKEVHRSKLNK
jgi:hypothetical protein